MKSQLLQKPGLNRAAMAHRCAMEFQDGNIANLGVGMPILCSSFVPEDRFIIFHSENGVIGYGSLATPETLDLHLVNAGVQHVTLMPFASIVHHADAFGVTRSGEPRFVKTCALPITAPGVVKKVFTNLGVFDIIPQSFVIREIAPDWTVEEVQELTEATIYVASDLREVAL